jgi:hypothetical protein
VKRIAPELLIICSCGASSQLCSYWPWQQHCMPQFRQYSSQDSIRRRLLPDCRPLAASTRCPSPRPQWTAGHFSLSSTPSLCPIRLRSTRVACFGASPLPSRRRRRRSISSTERTALRPAIPAQPRAALQPHHVKSHLFNSGELWKCVPSAGFPSF